MKIVFILPGMGGVSGGARSSVIAANGLLKRGHDVRILYRKSDTKSFLKSLWHTIISSAHPWIDDFIGIIGSFDDITKCHFDKSEIIVGVGMWASSQLSRLTSLANLKIQYIRGATPWDAKLMKEALSLPFPKIVVSSELKILAETYGGNSSISIIHNGLDHQEYFIDGDESSRNGIGTIYSSHPAKDPKTILTVIEHISKIRPEIPIRIFGSEKKPSRIKNVEYWRYPSIETARKIYSRSLVWIVASKSEGFAKPVQEAMACGCALVVTDCGGMRDIIKDGENGFLVPVGDIEQIVNMVLLLLEDNSLRQKLCLNAQETIKEFTWQKSIDNLGNVLKNLHNGQK